MAKTPKRRGTQMESVRRTASLEETEGTEETDETERTDETEDHPKCDWIRRTLEPAEHEHASDEGEQECVREARDGHGVRIVAVAVR